jgi:hypothetical protein
VTAPIDEDAHPLVATPSILARGNRLPGPAGERRPTGAFGKRSLDTLVAIAEALFSTDDGPCPPERLAWVELQLADLMARASPRGRFMFTMGAFAVSTIAPILVGRWPPFSRLPLPVRIEALTRFESRPIGSALIALKAVLCLVYYEHPDAAAEVGLVVGPGGRFR